MTYLSQRRNAKVVLLGESGVGKTCLRERYARNFYDPNRYPTIGLEFMLKQVEVIDPADGSSKTVTAQLWDTAGQERFRTLTKPYYRGAHAVVLVYDVNEPATFEGVNRWLEEAKTFLTGEDVVYLLIGNKTDVAKEKGADFAVSKEEGQRFTTEHNMFFALCSAATGEGVADAFDGVVRKVHEKNPTFFVEHGPEDIVPGRFGGLKDGEGGSGCC